MEQIARSALEAVSPLLKLVNQREDLFFQLFSFVHKNIECSSNDLDNITIFNKFLPSLKATSQTLHRREEELLRELGDLWQGEGILPAASKDIMNLSNRIYERLEASSTRVLKGLFDENGRSARDLIRFKNILHNKLKNQPFLISEYTHSVIHYTASKFTRQLNKIEQYIEKVSQGDNIFFKELYGRASDVDASSPEEKHEKKNHSRLKRPSLSLKIEGHSQHIAQEKRPRRLKSPSKKKHKPKEGESNHKKPSKEQTANKLLKFYEALALKPKQFLQDYVFKQQQKEKRKSELLNRLLERNKVINSQINNYVKKRPANTTSIINMPPAYLSKSSGDQFGESVKPEKTRFVISRRRGSFHLESSSAEKPHDFEKEMHMSTTRKINSHRKSSQSQSRTQKPQEKSRKLMVIKEQKLFDEQLIPQAQIHEPHFLQLPNSLKKDRRNQIRLKRKNNPSPLQNANFPQHFRYHP